MIYHISDGTVGLGIIFAGMAAIHLLFAREGYKAAERREAEMEEYAKILDSYRHVIAEQRTAIRWLGASVLIFIAACIMNQIRR
jgi:hypothetical protein